MIKKIIGIGLLVVSTTHTVFAQQLSANLGWASQYIFRGIPQKTSSVFGGLDFESGDFHLGTWAAYVGDGAEIDYYGGYEFEVENFEFSVGATWYTYTAGFDDDYLELNLGSRWKFLSFAAAIGRYDNFSGPTLQYQFYSLSASHNGLYGKIGTFKDDFDGTYFEAGYGNTITVRETGLFDYSFAIVHGNSALLGRTSDTNVVLTITRAFPF